MAVLCWAVGAFAQESKIPQMNEIVTLEDDDGDNLLQVFSLLSEEGKHYYLCVGELGFGDDVVQVLFDPIFKLFIPLGDTLDEAIETLREMQELFKQPKGTYIEMPGCLTLGFPDENKMETVKITYIRPILTRYLSFSLEREGYIRAAHVSKSDLGSIAASVKFHRKLHPKE